MEPNDAPSSSARAHELRASLGARREVEALLAQASATREAAVADADAIIEEAQQVSDQLLQETRTEAERVAADARHRAEGVVSRASSEAEDITRQARAAADAVRARAEAQVEEYRRRVRAELTEQVTREVAEQSRRELARVHERQQAMIGDLEASVRILGVSMEAAVANIGEMLGALDSLRTHAAESLGDPATSFPGPRQSEPLDHLIRATAPRREDRPAPAGGQGRTEGHESREQAGDGADESGDADDHDPASAAEPGSKPTGAVWVEYAAEDRLSADELADFGVDDVDDLDEPEDHGNRPLSATEAFLLSSHIDHDDPPLPPLDDAEIGARYARDAMRATARARSRRDEDTLDVVPGPSGSQRAGRDEPDAPESGDDDPSGKPLGWLFRSSS